MASEKTPATLSSRLFTAQDAWLGGFYELAVEYDADAANSLIAGLCAIWSRAEVTGCYIDTDKEPQEQVRLGFEPSLIQCGHLYGIAEPFPGKRIACGTCCVHESAGRNWLAFYLPMGSLGTVFPVGGFPYDDANHESWRIPVERWLASVGRDLYARVPFRLGLIGFETSGRFVADEIARKGLPTERFLDFLVPDDSGVAYFPRTSYVS